MERLVPGVNEGRAAPGHWARAPKPKSPFFFSESSSLSEVLLVSWPGPAVLNLSVEKDVVFIFIYFTHRRSRWRLCGRMQLGRVETLKTPLDPLLSP